MKKYFFSFVILMTAVGAMANTGITTTTTVNPNAEITTTTTTEQKMETPKTSPGTEAPFIGRGLPETGPQQRMENSSQSEEEEDGIPRNQINDIDEE